jgi:hypothetical protein
MVGELIVDEPSRENQKAEDGGQTTARNAETLKCWNTEITSLKAGTEKVFQALRTEN